MAVPGCARWIRRGWPSRAGLEGCDMAMPMATLVLHINREVFHHLAEVALLRDLWAHRDPVE